MTSVTARGPEFAPIFGSRSSVGNMAVSRQARPDHKRRDTRLRFEQWARNPRCRANTLSAVHGIRMEEVARADGIPSTMGQSPFAIARGQTFERSLFRDDAKALRQALIEAGVLPETTRGFADYRLRVNSGPMPDLDAAIAGTAELLRKIALGKAAPAVIAGATIRLPKLVMLPETILVADVVAVDTQGEVPTLIVGEIKTYPDRGGYTDGVELAQARAQAGVYVHGLRTAVVELDLADRLTVSLTGFLVLSRPGFSRPSVRAGEDLRFQAWRAQRGFRQLEEAAKGLPPPGNDDPIAAIRGAETHYCQDCVSFCERAPVCFSRAVEDGNAVVLGEDVARFLGKISLPRAVALLGGARPTDTAESDLARRLKGSAR